MEQHILLLYYLQPIGLPHQITYTRLLILIMLFAGLFFWKKPARDPGKHQFIGEAVTGGLSAFVDAQLNPVP